MHPETRPRTYLLLAILVTLLPLSGAGQEADLSAGEAASLARDIAASALSVGSAEPVVEGGAPGADSDQRFVELAGALERLAVALESGGTKDEARKAYDEAIFALARLSQKGSGQVTSVVSSEGAELLKSIQDLGSAVASAESDQK